ncbi:MAG: hypothetical protein P9L96_01360 [Candidatus Gygaella obscura]|nr:hypothetical protein [Candidatus Gygaella obscura]
MKKKKNKCPDVEMIACYVDGILLDSQKDLIESHAKECKHCKEEIECQISIAGQQKQEDLSFAPKYVTERAKSLVDERFGVNVLELVVKFTDKAIEIVRSSGEVLFGGQLQPAYALRGEESTDRSTQSIIKIFNDIKVEVEIVRQEDEFNKIILQIKNNQTATPIDDSRVTLIEKDIEVESYIIRNGKAIFENVKPGRYAIQISDVDKPIGIIMLELDKA